MGNTLCPLSRDGCALLAAATNSDLEKAEKILADKPGAAFFASCPGRRTALAIAAERGDLEMLKLVHQAAQRGDLPAQLCLDYPSTKQRTALMLACANGHTPCVEYLLQAGADASLATVNCLRETALHLAAHGGHHACVARLLSSTSVAERGIIVQLSNSITEEGQRYVDAVNGAGLSALHLATLCGSAPTARALIRGGASLDSQIGGGRSRPPSEWLCAGSTALHLASARGFPAIAILLLDAQATNPGATDLRRIRNSRGLKPSQCARLEGHHDLARLLHAAPTPPGLPPRRSRRAAAELRAAAPNLEALMQLLAARAKLLLSLRSIVLHQKVLDPSEGKQSDGSSPEGSPAAASSLQQAAAEQGAVQLPATGQVAEAVGASGDPSSAVDILQLLSTLDPTTSMAPQTDVPPEAAVAAEGLEPGSQEEAARQLAQEHRLRSHAATALVQAALDAIESTARSGLDASRARALASPASESATAAALLASATGAAEVWAQPLQDRSSRSRRLRRVRAQTAALSLEELFPPGTPRYDAGTLAPPEAMLFRSPSLLQRLRQRSSSRRRRRQSSLPPAHNDSSAAYLLDILSAHGAEQQLQDRQQQRRQAGQMDSQQQTGYMFDDPPPVSQQQARSQEGIPQSTEQCAQQQTEEDAQQGIEQQQPGSSSWFGSSRRSLDVSVCDGQPIGPPSERQPQAQQPSSGAGASATQESAATAAARANHASNAASCGGRVQSGTTVATPSLPPTCRRGPIRASRAAFRDVVSAFAFGSGGGVGARSDTPSEDGGMASSRSSQEIQPARRADAAAMGAGEASWEAEDAGTPSSPLEPAPHSADSVSTASADEGDDTEASDLKPTNKGRWESQAEVSPGVELEPCAICMDRGVEVAVGGCGHGLCVRCAYQLCARGLALPACPFCRATISVFEPASQSPLPSPLPEELAQQAA